MIMINQFFLHFTIEYIKWRAVRSVLVYYRNEVQKKIFQCFGAISFYLDLNGFLFFILVTEDLFFFKQKLSSWEIHVSIN